MQQQSGQPQSSGSAGAACAQEARRLGFNVLDVGAPVQAFDGSQDVQILVQWANGGATHIRCRYDRTYGVTLG